MRHDPNTAMTNLSIGTFAQRLIPALVLISPIGESSTVSAQHAERGRRLWVQFTTEQGLPSNRVDQILDDGQGTVWARTGFGLVWFDGYRWKRPPPFRGDQVGSRLRAVPHPERGLILLRDSALLHVDTGSVHLLGEHAALLATTSMAPLDANDGVLILTEREAYRLDAGGLHRANAPDGWTGGGSPFSSLARTRHGGIWASTPSGTFEWSGTDWVRRSREITSRFRSNGTSDEVLGIRWEPTPGVWSWRPGQDRLSWIPGQDDTPPISIDVSPTGTVMVLYDSGRLRVRREGIWQWVDPVPEAYLMASSLRFDATGDTWITTDVGVFLERVGRNQWAAWPLADASGANELNDILLVPNGEIWLATSYGLVVHRPDGNPEHITEIDGRTLGAMTALGLDRDGAIWAATAAGAPPEAGALRFRDGTWTRFGRADGFPEAGIHRIVPDRSGRLWFLMLQGPDPDPNVRAMLWDGDSMVPFGPADGFDARRVYDFAEGTDGSRWFATSSGLWEQRNDRWRQWTTDNSKIRANRLFAVALDQNDRPWFGHYVRGFGLGHMPAGDSVRYLTAADGLVHEAVWDVASGADGTMWATTSGGLAAHTQDGLFAFREEAGLPDATLWPLAVTDSMVYVGTNQAGLAGLDLGGARSPPPTVEFEGITVDGSQAVVRWSVAGYRGVPRTSSILTRYRIDDDPWSPWTEARQAVVNRLNAGRHVVTVEAAGLLFSTDRTQAATTEFRIAPPWYRHPLFLGGVVAWLCSMLIAALLVVRRARSHERALRRRERYFRSLIENAVDLITVLDEKGRITYQSPSVKNVLGYRPEDLVGQPVLTVIHPDRHQEVQDILERGAIGERFVDLEIKHRDGSWRILQSIGLTVKDPGEASYTVINSRDVTGERQALDKLRNNEELTRLVVDTALDAVITADTTGRILRWNSQAENIFGWTRDEAVGCDLADTIIPDRYREAHRAGLKRYVETGKARMLGRRVQIEGRRKDGTEFPLELSIRAVGDSSRPRFSAFLRDITEQTRAEEELRHSEERYRRLFDATGDAILVFDISTRRIVDVNALALEMYGYTREELIDRDPTELSADPERAANAIREVLAGGKGISEFQTTHRRKDGTLFPVDIRAGIFSAGDQTMHTIVVRDLTERHELEGQLRQALKMEALGTLSGGIAHDFNNILLAITGYTDLVAADPGLTPKGRRFVDQVATAADRASGLVKQILAFSRRSEPELRPTDFPDLVNEALGLVRASLPSTIELRTNVQPDAGTILADAPQIHQILLNLTSNAAHAMPAGGVLHVDLQSITLEDATARRVAHDLTPGKYIRLIVRDTGNGIDAASLGRIFDPFFTTKAVGRGTGLGLSAVHGNVKSHGGAVTVDSVVDQGTTFRLYFPRHDQAAPEPAAHADTAFGGGGRILFVDDESQLAELGRITLQRLGYEVEAFTDSERAVDRFLEDPGAFDVVVTDLTMPRKTGFDVAEEVKRRRSDLPVVLATGHNDRIDDAALPSRGIDVVLVKPYTTSQLAEAIGKVLRDSDTSSTAA